MISGGQELRELRNWRNWSNQHNTAHVNPSQIYYSQEQLDQEKLLPQVHNYRLIYTDIVNGYS